MSQNSINWDDEVIEAAIPSTSGNTTARHAILDDSKIDAIARTAKDKWSGQWHCWEVNKLWNNIKKINIANKCWNNVQIRENKIIIVQKNY